MITSILALFFLSLFIVIGLLWNSKRQYDLNMKELLAEQNHKADLAIAEFTARTR